MTCPIWLIKTRIQLQTDTNPLISVKNPAMRNYHGYKDAIVRIFREDKVCCKLKVMFGSVQTLEPYYKPGCRVLPGDGDCDKAGRYVNHMDKK